MQILWTFPEMLLSEVLPGKPLKYILSIQIYYNIEYLFVLDTYTYIVLLSNFFYWKIPPAVALIAVDASPAADDKLQAFDPWPIGKWTPAWISRWFNLCFLRWYRW